jgi:hypothetical protein
MMDSLLPNFLIIGAAKSGTTSLWYYLHQHPQIYFAPIKEPRFFAFEGESVHFRGPGDDKWGREVVSTWDQYQALFRPPAHVRRIGEASNVYLYLASTAAPRIAARLPQAKLLAILRHPVDRAYSNFLMLRGEGRESIKDFRTALRQEKKRLSDGWSPGWAYARRGFYADAIETYQRYFPASQLRFFLYDDLVRNPAQLFADIFSYLGVDEFEPEVSHHHNVSTLPRSRSLAFYIHNRSPLSRTLRLFLPAPLRLVIHQRLRRANARRPDPLSPEVRDELLPMFSDDIKRAADLIGRDLSHWLRPSGGD